MTKVLYISGSVGLGHVVRDLTVVNELRRIEPTTDISWLAENPAAMFLRERGEKVLPESSGLFNGNSICGRPIEDYRADTATYITEWQGHWKSNWEIYRMVQEEDDYDLIVADEAWDIMMADVPMTSPLVMVTDHIGREAMSSSSMELDFTSALNKSLYEGMTSNPKFEDFIFVGQDEDIPDEPLGLFLPGKREIAKEHASFVNYILPFDPEEYLDKEKMRKRLGYGHEPLIVCSVGGTGLGKALLKLCAQAHTITRKEIPDLQTILVTGPIIPPSDSLSTEGVDVKGYVPDLYEDLAASDLAVVAGGGMTTLELTALQKPFIYFPLEGHFEQQRIVAPRCKRWKAGVRMSYDGTSPQNLADLIKDNIKKASHSTIPIGGEKRAAKILYKAIEGG